MHVDPLLLATITNATDFLTTLPAVNRFGAEVERFPPARVLMEKLGPNAGLVVATLLTQLSIMSIHYAPPNVIFPQIADYVLYGIGALKGVISLSNLIQFLYTSISCRGGRCSRNYHDHRNPPRYRF